MTNYTYQTSILLSICRHVDSVHDNHADSYFGHFWPRTGITEWLSVPLLGCKKNWTTLWHSIWQGTTSTYETHFVTVTFIILLFQLSR